jgi:vacuolar-type H+-ATPase subunit E/Vma4
MLRVEGEIVNEVLDRARKRLTDFRETAEYAGFLTRLSVEGILALEDNTCVLAPAAADAKLFTPQKVAEITSIAERLTGREIKLSLANDASLHGFGVRVYAGSKRTLFDNTLAARLERLADELRMIVVKEVFAPAPPDASSGRGSGAGGQEYR